MLPARFLECPYLSAIQCSCQLPGFSSAFSVILLLFSTCYATWKATGALLPFQWPCNIRRPRDFGCSWSGKPDYWCWPWRVASFSCMSLSRKCSWFPHSTCFHFPRYYGVGPGWPLYRPRLCYWIALAVFSVCVLFSLSHAPCWICPIALVMPVS